MKEQQTRAERQLKSTHHTLQCSRVVILSLCSCKLLHFRHSGPRSNLLICSGSVFVKIFMKENAKKATMRFLPFQHTVGCNCPRTPNQTKRHLSQDLSMKHHLEAKINPNVLSLILTMIKSNLLVLLHPT